MKKRIISFFIVLSLFAFFSMANFSLAQDFGVEEVGDGLNNALGQASQDPRIVAGRLIQYALGFLGVIGVLLVMYAGFLWMTSGGEEDKIKKAKDILKSSVIGLVIILSSWGVTTFLLNRFSDIITNNGTNNGSYKNNNSFSSSASSAIGSCSVESIYPNDGQKDVPRNTSILVTFMEEADLSNACVDSAGATCACNNNSCNKISPKIFRLFKKDLGDACSSVTCPDINSNVTDVKLSFTSDKKTIILSPINYLGSGTEHTPYTFKIDGDLKKTNGSSMFSACAVSSLEANFSVSNLLDLEPPIVNRSGIFPLPDNSRDLLNLSTPAKKAEALIEVKSCPKQYSPATVLDISPEGPEVKLDYKGDISNFKVVVPAGEESKAQLFNGENNTLLGIVDWNLENEVVFPDYLSLKTDSHVAGDIWEVRISPEVLADTLRLNNQVYTFSDRSVNNNIAVVPSCSASSLEDLSQQATNIQAVLSGNLEVESSLDASRVNLKSKVAGTSGNNIALETTSKALGLKLFSGGLDKIVASQAKDKVDRPRNSAIQFTFDEPVNPITVSGSATEVSNFVRVLNYNKEAGKANASCSKNSDCLSYKCENSVCLGDHLSGRFMVSNNYRTVEFLTDEECGLNACGDKIYCLPANSHLRVEVSAANLQKCETASDCSSFSPFSACLNNADLGYKTCQNPDRKNYPTANVDNIDGVVDVAVNSFDGNRSEFSSGPVAFYNENVSDTSKKDNYSWSFFVSDEINLSPPQITSITPNQGEKKVSLGQDVEIKFNKLMLNSSLRSGKIDIFDGKDNIEHKLINIKSSNPSPFGFWVHADNIDTEPLNGEPDLTIANIKHSPFAESLTFFAQVGSGVKDIYQNCYKPSVGPGCANTDASCCFGSATSELDSDGNCQF